ncbi:MAG: mechanosensitive ion channel family protein [Blastocatellales bacterium]
MIMFIHNPTPLRFRIREIACGKIPPFRFSILLACCVSVLAMGGLAQSPQTETASATPSIQNGQGIPLPEIATRAEQIKRPIREITARLSPNSVTLSIGDQVNALEAQMESNTRQIEERIGATPTLYELREMERDLSIRSLELDRWQKIMTEAVSQAESDLQWVKTEDATWKLTLDQLPQESSFEVVAERIRLTRAELQKLQAKVQERLSQLLILQDKVSQQDFLISSQLDHISLVKQRFQDRLLNRDNRPLWSALLSPTRDEFSGGFKAEPLGQSLAHELSAAREQLKAQKGNFILLSLLFITILLLNRALAKRIDPLTKDDPELHLAAEVLKRPVSVALLITLLIYLWQSPIIAGIVNSVIALLLLIAFLRVIRLLIGQPVWLRIPPYVLAILHLSDRIRLLVDIAPVIERVVFLIEVVIAIVVVFWMLRPARLSQLSESESAQKWLRGALRVILTLLMISFFANVFGFFTLAKVVGEGTLHSGYLGALFYGAARVVNIVFELLLRTNRAQLLAFVRSHQVELSRWFSRGSFLIAGFLWLQGTLELFTIREQVIDAVTQTLDASLRFRSLQISAGDVLSFLLVVVLAYYLSRIVRLILQEDVLARVPLKRGVPQALATAAQYVLLLAGFIIAVSAAGFDLSKLTLLTGAFGVGIGFGLQNVVNNFVSGLILLFERPVQVGDAVRVGDVSGEVTRIGIRSTTIRTYQGAEVIVPNAKLISDEVTNWTLTNQTRRVEIYLGVAYGTDPAKVIELLVETAKSHPDVLADPEPMALFIGFGDSALQFELRFWASIQTHVAAKSQITANIAAVMNEAEIEIPFPQRDLHIRSVDEKVKSLATGKGGLPEKGT